MYRFRNDKKNETNGIMIDQNQSSFMDFDSDEKIMNQISEQQRDNKQDEQYNLLKPRTNDIINNDTTSFINQQEQQQQITDTPKKIKIRNGFIVLGMHRSGTSMLTGLLVTGLGYNVSGPLIKPNKTNKKGFF